MANIEQLRKETDDITESLKKLKDDVSLSEVEKKEKAEALKTQAEKTKEKIQNEINALADKTDDESKKKKEEAETLLGSFNETMDLYASILNLQVSQRLKETINEAKKKQKEEKGFLGKAGDWIGEQWEKVKENPGKYVLGATGLVAAGWAIKKAWNWAFGDDEEKSKEEKDSSPKTEGQSFRKTGWGKILKWTGIATASGGGIYGISKLFGGKSGNQVEVEQIGGDEISEAMLEQLLYIEGDQDFVAKTHKKNFGENFVTGPYGMVYKHIDENGNLLNNPIHFKNGERVSKDWAKKNAKAYYNKRAKEWSNLLKGKGYKYDQSMLDALVSASGGTEKSVKKLREFVLSHWDDKDAIFNFMSKFATTAAGNGKTMPGLVIRRNFEANWFKGNKEPLSEYQKRYYQDRHYA